MPKLGQSLSRQIQALHYLQYRRLDGVVSDLRTLATAPTLASTPCLPTSSTATLYSYYCNCYAYYCCYRAVRTSVLFGATIPAVPLTRRRGL
eukprot:3269726-Rhodomonas_salina.2